MLLARDQIDVWWRRYDRDVPRDYLDRAWTILSKAERDANRRFASYDRQCEDLLTRAMIRSLVGCYLGWPPGEIVFDADADGRPAIGSPAAAGLTFNIAHAKGLIVCAFGRDRGLGVDVEHATGEGDLSFVLEHLSTIELADLARAAAAGRRPSPLQYWVLKEAYLKALGLGLTVDPATCTFAIDGGGAAHLVRATDGDRRGAHAWTFAFLDLSTDHLTALGYSRAPDEVVTVQMRSFIGLTAHA